MKPLLAFLLLCAPAIADVRHLAPCEVRSSCITQSMFPILKGGELLRIEPIAWEDIEAGLQGTFLECWDPWRRANIAHRVVRKIEKNGKRWVVMRGDANATNDEFCYPESCINGRVVIIGSAQKPQREAQTDHRCGKQHSEKPGISAAAG